MKEVAHFESDITTLLRVLLVSISCMIKINHHIFIPRIQAKVLSRIAVSITIILIQITSYVLKPLTLIAWSFTYHLDWMR